MTPDFSDKAFWDDYFCGLFSLCFKESFHFLLINFVECLFGSVIRLQSVEPIHRYGGEEGESINYVVGFPNSVFCLLTVFVLLQRNISLSFYFDIHYAGLVRLQFVNSKFSLNRD